MGACTKAALAPHAAATAHRRPLTEPPNDPLHPVRSSMVCARALPLLGPRGRSQGSVRIRPQGALLRLQDPGCARSRNRQAHTHAPDKRHTHARSDAPAAHDLIPRLEQILEKAQATPTAQTAAALQQSQPTLMPPAGTPGAAPVKSTLPPLWERGAQQPGTTWEAGMQPGAPPAPARPCPCAALFHGVAFTF